MLTHFYIHCMLRMSRGIFERLSVKSLHFSVQTTLLTLYYTATEIQNIQIGDGDVTRDFAIPMYMIFPRLFTCPTLITPTFKIGVISNHLLTH